MWKYIRKYLSFAIIAGLFMVGEVMMDLVQPGFMSRIVDDGVLGVSNGGSADPHFASYLREHVFDVPAEFGIRVHCTVRFPVSGGRHWILPVESKSPVFQAAGASGCHQ